ncbi:NUDIX domain-containing protein [Gordonia sp. ABSL1-1]|uniref:NUDIX hydrolase n=1 Tax=Gordonia sp. ABSL1-1 TaxID=3053923 RepID=UPI00257327B6|nr:NUDIX domain-containing protein [Gordonia sp. ABSL1-1]MDL9938300.1 NUDIX domain-containing protein [Gordonia sp. ABSL1-1]
MSSRIPDDVIVVSAVVLRGADGAVLTVRKRGTTRFMFPGGKPEAGETAVQTAVRETREELDVELDIDLLTYLGTFTTAAANESRTLVHATVFTYPLPLTNAAPSAEIAEIRWQRVEDGEFRERTDLAPLLAEAVFPALTS